ncbi:hydroxyethylthiazole kinase [Shigella flexneri]
MVGTGCALSAVARLLSVTRRYAGKCRICLSLDEQAGERAVARSEGPGQFVRYFLDALWQLTQEVQA